MTTYILIGCAGLAVCGWLVVRHALRTAAELPPESDRRAPRRRPDPMAGFQSNVQLDTNSTYSVGAKAKRRLMERLQQEERRQRPQEGRN